jgi:hypothetical protein
MRKAYNILVSQENSNETGPLGELGTDGRQILKLILKRQVCVGVGYIHLLGARTSDRLL